MWRYLARATLIQPKSSRTWWDQLSEIRNGRRAGQSPTEYMLNPNARELISFYDYMIEDFEVLTVDFLSF